MQDKVTRHMDTNDQMCDREKIVVLVGQTHVHLHASWLYQRHNQPEGRDYRDASLDPVLVVAVVSHLSWPAGRVKLSSVMLEERRGEEGVRQVPPTLLPPSLTCPVCTQHISTLTILSAQPDTATHKITP